jgi:Tfp pilus assembly protein PilF
LRGDAEGALAHFAEAVRVRPASADARYNYGRVLCERGDVALGIEQFEQALRLDPEHRGVRDAMELWTSRPPVSGASPTP